MLFHPFDAIKLSPASKFLSWVLLLAEIESPSWPQSRNPESTLFHPFFQKSSSSSSALSSKKLSPPLDNSLIFPSSIPRIICLRCSSSPGNHFKFSASFRTLRVKIISFFRNLDRSLRINADNIMSTRGMSGTISRAFISLYVARALSDPILEFNRSCDESNIENVITSGSNELFLSSNIESNVSKATADCPQRQAASRKVLTAITSGSLIRRKTANAPSKSHVAPNTLIIAVFTLK
mmetsp:Transcript_13092/g.14584  ORF Transcript_13092/g.14584 Transcript_13092/m.14584 type:complete len:237 (-) Transcript_13092:1821-2531(-)